MVFGRKKKDEGAESPEQKQVKRRSPNEMLASVVRESTVGAAVDLLKQNERFALPGNKSWVGLLLDTKTIGGLSKKESGDEAKGSIVQLINSDLIQVVVTRELLAEDCLVFIPTVQTLDRMKEFSLLSGATYHWMVLTESEDRLVISLPTGLDETADAKLPQAEAIARGDRSLAEEMPEQWAQSGGGDVPAQESTDSQEAQEDQIRQEASQAETEALPKVEDEGSADGATDDAGESAGDQEAPQEAEADAGDDPLADAVDPTDDGIDYEALDDSGEDEVDEADFADEFDPDAPVEIEHEGDDELFYEDDPDESDDDANAYLQYVEENRDRTVTEDEVRATIARRFLSDELDLTVTLDEFETIFNTDAPAISIEIAENPNDWLGSQVAQLARQANAALEQAHQRHVDELRSLYVDAMGLHVENVVKRVSPDREGSVYRDLNQAARTEFEEAKKRAAEDASTQRREITDRFEKEADERAAQAAAHARVQFKDRNRPEFDRRLAEVGVDVDRRNEERYNQQRQEIQEMRRKDAAMQVDLGVTRTLSLLSERANEHREAEKELLEHWNSELTRFIDENRKNDVARAEALAEQLRRDNSIETLKKEHAAQIEQIHVENADRQRRLENEIERHNARALAELKERESKWQHEVNLLENRVDGLNKANDALTSQVATVREEVETSWRKRVHDLENDKKSYGEELERANAIQTRSNKILVVLVVVLALAALAVGIIIGWLITQAGGNSAEAMVMLPEWVQQATGTGGLGGS